MFARAGPAIDRVAQHEVRAVEEEENEEQHELVLAPRPPHAPRRTRPDRAGDERQRAEDDALVDRDVALEVGALVARAQIAQRLPRAPAEARVRRERDRHVEVEDPLREALVGVGRRVEEDERDRRAERDRRQGRQLHGANGSRTAEPQPRRSRTRTSPRRTRRRSRRTARGTRGSRRRRRPRSGSPSAGRAAAAGARGRARRRPSRRTASRRRRCRGRRAPPRRPSARRGRGRTPRTPAARRPRLRPGTRAPRSTCASQIALRSHGVRMSASNMPCSRSATNARVRPSSAVKTSADQSRPRAATSLVPAGSAKWKIVSAEITNRSIDGSVSFARSSSSRSLRASAADVGDVRHANTSLSVARASNRAASCVATTWSRGSSSTVSSNSSAVRVERVRRLVEHEQRRLVQQRAAEPEPLLHAARERRDALVAHLPQAEPLEQHPDALALDPVEPREQRQVLERRQLAVDVRAVTEVADRSRAGSSSEPADGAASRARMRSERRLAGAVRPGDEQEPVGELEIDADAARAGRRTASRDPGRGSRAVHLGRRAVEARPAGRQRRTCRRSPPSRRPSASPSSQLPPRRAEAARRARALRAATRPRRRSRARRRGSRAASPSSPSTTRRTPSSPPTRSRRHGSRAASRRRARRHSAGVVAREVERRPGLASAARRRCRRRRTAAAAPRPPRRAAARSRSRRRRCPRSPRTRARRRRPRAAGRSRG